MTYIWKIQLFAGLAQRFEKPSITLELAQSELTAKELKQYLVEQYPEQQRVLKSCYVAANQAYCRDEQSVKASDELALLPRSEEHTSELQSRENLVCRLLLEKKNRR